MFGVVVMGRKRKDEPETYAVRLGPHRYLCLAGGGQVWFSFDVDDAEQFPTRDAAQRFLNRSRQQLPPMARLEVVGL